MRFIRKKAQCYHYSLSRANEKPPQTAEQATSRWDSFNKKKDLQNLLLEEQFYLCAYSEIRPDLEQIGAHIEHIEPKSQHPGRTFDYQNLVACALSEHDLTQYARADHFGGHAKLGQYDSSRFISCLDESCAKTFAYLSDGRIVPSLHLAPIDQANAQYTIDLLNLNCGFLVNRRKQWLDDLDALIDKHLTNDYSLTDLAAIDLLPCNKKLSPFFTATRQRFGRIAEQVLQAYPELL